MSVIPRSLCNTDGTLYIPTDKASLMHAIEGAEDVSVDRSTLLERETASHPPRVLIIDAMAVINSMKKTVAIRTFPDFQNAFVGRIENMMTGYSECRVVFDRYLE